MILAKLNRHVAQCAKIFYSENAKRGRRLRGVPAPISLCISR